MPDLAILTPTRGRPVEFARMVAAVNATAVGDVAIYAARDYDDQTDYLPELDRATPNVLTMIGDRRSLSGWTNLMAKTAIIDGQARYLASFGDDHVPRTPGWDLKLIAAIKDMGGTGIAYGNDLLQGQALPTAWVMSVDIVQALGWMMLPACEHLFVDNAILAIGRTAGCIAYRPDVVIEHLHPAAGKAQFDDSYRASNSAARMSADQRAFEQWKSAPDGLTADAWAVALLLGPVGR
jgi:hypothetical protein